MFRILLLMLLLEFARCEEPTGIDLGEYEEEAVEYERNFLRSMSCPECAGQIRQTTKACGVKICNCSSGDIADLRTNSQDFNLTILLETSSYYDSLSTPQLHCADKNIIAFTWQAKKDTFYWFSYHTPWPGDVEETSMTHCGYQVINELLPGTWYKFRMNSITVLSNGISRGRSKEFWHQTKAGGPPQAVSNFSIERWLLTENKYTAHLSYQKGRDRACFYDVVWFSDSEADYETLDISDPLAPEEFNITGLSFGQNYYIAITAYTTQENGLPNESDKRWLNVTVPSCIESYVGLTNCTPEQPENFTVVERFKQYDPKTGSYYFNIYMNWSEPKYIPNYYVAKLTIYDEEESFEIKNISGDSINATFRRVRLGPEYRISLVAVSPRGPSYPAVIHRQINETFQEPAEKSALTAELIIMFIICPLVIAGIILMVIVNYFLSKRVRQKQMRKYFKGLDNEKLPASVMTSISTISEEVTRPIDKWEVDPNRLTVNRILGRGEFGIVRKGWFKRDEDDHVEVAIKMMKENPTPEIKKQFFQEIEIMKSVPAHPHLVALIGCVTRGNPLLVVEYCPKGDLQSYLRRAWKLISNNTSATMKKGEDPDDAHGLFAINKLYDSTVAISDYDDVPQPKDLLSYARQIVIGMEHLASLKLIHRDLAARNILVQDSHTVKISDFGLSRDVYYDNIYCKQTGGKLPVRWMALESMTHQMYTTQSDVWSFGILLWEIVTMGGTPYPGIATQDLLGMLKRGYRMEKPPNCSDELYSIMVSCWKACPKGRPTFADLRKTFEGLLEEVSYYLNLNFSESKQMTKHYTVDAHYNKTYFQERYIKPLK